jgi:hypothetical protein
LLPHEAGDGGKYEKGLFLYSKKKGFEMGAEKKEKKFVRKRFFCK